MRKRVRQTLAVPWNSDSDAALELGDAEDDELGWLDRRDADHHHELTGVDHLGRVGLLVALDEEGLLGGASEQRAVAPHAGEEGADVAADLVPQELVVGFEHDPVGALDDRLLDHVEEPAHVEVAPLGVDGAACGRPRPGCRRGW